MTNPTFEAASATLVQANGTTNAPAKPTGTVEDSLLIEALAVGSNVDQVPSSEFTPIINGPRISTRPALMVARHVADDTEPSTYSMGTGASLSQNSGCVFRFEGYSADPDPIGQAVQADAASGSNLPSITATGVPVGDRILYLVSLSTTRTVAGPAWTRMTQNIASNLHAFTEEVPGTPDTTVDVTVSGLTLTGGVAQMRVALIVIKKRNDTPSLGSVAEAGVLQSISEASKIEVGAKVPLGISVVRSGAKVPLA